MSAGQNRNQKEPKEMYIVQNFLGKGAFGEAYLIKSDKTQIYYVIKRINLEKLEKDDIKKVNNEAILLKMIDHPNIIRFKEVFQVVHPIQQLNIIMEYANGGDLNKLIKSQMPKNFEEAILIDWLCQLCHALQYIHNKKIIHRDIKPANIFLNNLGQVKLGDFGVAKNLDTLKMASTFIGTFDYLSPEIVEGKNYSFEADIWSLGVTFYELMTFKKPFEGNNYATVILKIINDEIKPINEPYSNELKNLINKMLSKDPSKRPKPKDILKMGFIKNRMLSYLQEKRFNFKDSFNIIQNYKKKKINKLNNYVLKNHMLNNYNSKNNFNEMNGINNNISKKLQFLYRKNSSNSNIKNINNNSNIKYKFNLKSGKELNQNLINQRYKILEEKENNKEKESSSNKETLNHFRHSVQDQEKRNKITLSKTRIGKITEYSNQEDKMMKMNYLISSEQNYSKNIKFNQFKNGKNLDDFYKKNISSKENSIKFSLNDLKRLNDKGKDKDKYDLHRQMNIVSSLVNGIKTDEQIEEENNIFIKNFDYDNFYS